MAALTNSGARLRARQETGRLVAAVCAAPLALVAHGVFPDRARTCHPSVAERVGVTEVRPLIEDGPLVTGPGPGACFEVALAVVARLQGHERAAEVRGPLML
ncbi:MAG: DJ-1/PfpI family protein [Sandaracinus sp.]|nr:DJ-1/PfpI family protein [Sandaracinus sp.]MCB9618277.1 DJ-1/PfpI family protein [Sandaracinus sp.]MCB9624155.1 DJ-1/PfpI family protein [Sandaracinus sp.]MCB9634407.1 DJ-1/PfpI family protein [Sandaracinus sp.]